MLTRTARRPLDPDVRWILPAGTLGDALVLSAVLRTGFERTGERFGLVRMKPYTSLFMGHPAISEISTPDPATSRVIRTDIWNAQTSPELAGARPFTKLCVSIFGTDWPETAPWAPLVPEDDAPVDALGLRVAPIVLANGAETVRHEWPERTWSALAGRLAGHGVPLVQVGPSPTAGLKGALNLTGLLQPRSVLALVRRSQACVSVDPFVTAAARMFDVPTLAIYGPTDPATVGFDGQLNVHRLGKCPGPCLATHARDVKPGPCPEPEFCMEQLRAEEVDGLFAAHLADKVSAARAFRA